MTHPKPDLPPLPEPAHGYREIIVDGLYLRNPQFTEEQMESYALAAIQMERERCAQRLLRISNAPDMQAYAAAIRDQGRKG